MNELPVWLVPPLQSLLASRATLHHALLFSGPEGVGKEWLARSLAAGLLCDQPRENRLACGQCAACRWMSQDSHPDFRLLRPTADEPVAEEGETPSPRPAKVSRDIRIEQIRGLAGFVEVASHRGGAKVILITPAEAMNSAAANALLKTLEEPPRNTFFSVGHQPGKPTAGHRSFTLPAGAGAHPPAGAGTCLGHGPGARRRGEGASVACVFRGRTAPCGRPRGE